MPASAPAQRGFGKRPMQGRRRKARVQTNSSYIYKVLKQVHPDVGISRMGMAIVNDMLNSLALSLVTEMRTLRERAGTKTSTAREVQTAVRLVFPGELAKHAVSEGTKAVAKYGMGRGGSRTARAGLQFSVPRAERFVRTHMVEGRVNANMAAYFAAVLEYTCAEILELAGNASRDMKKSRIVPRHIMLAIRGDEELDRIFRGVVRQGGVVPTIHQALLPRTPAGRGGSMQFHPHSHPSATTTAGGISFAPPPAPAAAAGGFSFAPAAQSTGFTFGGAPVQQQPVPKVSSFGGSGPSATPGGPSYAVFQAQGGAGGAPAAAYDVFQARGGAPPADYDTFDASGGGRAAEAATQQDDGYDHFDFARRK